MCAIGTKRTCRSLGAASALRDTWISPTNAFYKQSETLRRSHAGHANTDRMARRRVLRRLAYGGSEQISSRKRSQFCSLFRDELKKSLSLCFFDLSGEYFAETFDIKTRNHGVERDGI